MDARIYRPAKSAMQSGRANTRNWVLEFAPAAPKVVDPLMGWTGGSDTAAQVRLCFVSKAEAIAYARKHGLDYHVFEPSEQALRPKSYADNFRYDGGR